MTTQSNFRDVQDFHEKFGLHLERNVTPGLLMPSLARFRIGFMIEELAEYAASQGAPDIAMALSNLAIDSRTCEINTGGGDLLGAADALVDLVVVALGTADFHAIPWQACWDEVHRANMSKVRAAADGSNSKRGSSFDVVKPKGWKPPDHLTVLMRTRDGSL
jgi:predicted HAD superfamily Cof-like phosphohydrolase